SFAVGSRLLEPPASPGHPRPRVATNRRLLPGPVAGIFSGTTGSPGVGGTRAYGLRSFLRRAHRGAQGRGPLPGLRRFGAHRRPLPARALAWAQGRARGDGLVLERLSRHGPAPG